MLFVIRQELHFHEPLQTIPKVTGNARGITGVLCNLHSRALSENRWDEMLPDVSTSIRTLIGRATNSTPHDQVFGFPRRRSSVQRIANWLAPKNGISLETFVRNNSDPLIKPSKVVEVVNDLFVRIQRPSGSIDSVSLSTSSRGSIAPNWNRSDSTEQTTMESDFWPSELKY